MSDDTINMPMKLDSNDSQERARWNLLRCTRYAQMSPEKKRVMLAQQQVRRAKATSSRDLQEPLPEDATPLSTSADLPVFTHTQTSPEVPPQMDNRSENQRLQ